MVESTQSSWLFRIVYFKDLDQQCKGGAKKFGGITDREAMLANLRMNCLPEAMLDGVISSYEDFLEQRRKLMASRIKAWFELR